MAVTVRPSQRTPAGVSGAALVEARESGSRGSSPKSFATMVEGALRTALSWRSWVISDELNSESNEYYFYY